MRKFLIAVVLVSAAFSASAQARPRPIGELYAHSSQPQTPGEPPPVVLVVTGLAGVVLVGMRRRVRG